MLIFNELQIFKSLVFLISLLFLTTFKPFVSETWLHFTSEYYQLIKPFIFLTFNLKKEKLQTKENRNGVHDI